MLCGVIIVIIVFAVVSANFVADWRENNELSGEELKKFREKLVYAFKRTLGNCVFIEISFFDACLSFFQAKEEMAWKIAKMIIEDVKSEQVTSW